MPGFLYYLPRVTADQVTDAMLVDRKLDYALTTKAVRCACRQGPDGGPGIVMAEPPFPSENVGYYATRQTWRAIPSKDAWIGYETDAKPTPDDLARPDQMGGYLLTMADGREWLVPVAMQASEADGQIIREQSLPQRLDLDDAGAFCPAGVLPAYRRLDAIASAFAAKAAEAEGNSFVFGGSTLCGC